MFGSIINIWRITNRRYSIGPPKNVNQDKILVETIGSIVTIGINRPEKRNSLDFETVSMLSKAIENFENDTSIVAAVLYGIGGNFSSGFDLKMLSEMDETELVQNIKQNTQSPTTRYIKKPIIAAISGYAVAGGLELAMMCDLRVVEENAILGAFNRRFGVPFIDGGTVRLQASIGLSRALDLILTGRSLSAKEAFEWGVANRVVACGTSLGQAVNLATSLVKFPQEPMLLDRNSTYNAAFNSAYQELLEQERENGTKTIWKNIIENAKKFTAGIGRHGKTHNLTEQKVKEWEQEYDNDKNNNVKSKL